MLKKCSSVTAVLLTFSLNPNTPQNNPKPHQRFDSYFKEVNKIDPLMKKA